MKICFHLCRYQNQNFSLVSHLCHLCSTCVAPVLHSCHSCLALVLWNRLDQNSMVSNWIENWSDPVLFFTNLFLHYYENNSIKKSKNNNIRSRRRFANVFRLIDDNTALYNSREFNQSLKEIYPPELVLKKGNGSNSERSLLDLFVKVENNQFYIQLYDKRDDFPFSIVKITYLRSSRPEVFCKKGVFRNFTKFTGKRRKTLAQVFSCEIYEISENTFFYRTPLVAACDI